MELTSYAKDIATGPPGFIGGHGLAKAGGLYPALAAKTDKKGVVKSGHGVCLRLVCSRSSKPATSAVDSTQAQQRDRPSSKCGCPMKVWLEHCNGYVSVMEFTTLGHNHELVVDAAEKAASAVTRDKISDEVLEKAKTWARRLPLSAVIDVLKDEVALGPGWGERGWQWRREDG